MEKSSFDFLNHPGTRFTLKLGLILFLILILMIPRFMILDLIRERKSQSDTVAGDVAVGWGGDQTFTGPVLVIPYEKWTVQEESLPKVRTKHRLLVFPDVLDISGNLDTETKHRNIYEVLLYKSGLKASGSFSLPDPASTRIPTQDMLLNEAYVIMGFSDMRGITDKIRFDWAGTPVSFSPGMENASFSFSSGSGAGVGNYDGDNHSPRVPVTNGLKARVTLDKTKASYNFSCDVSLKGSNSLMFAPLARTTNVTLASPYPDPVFKGSFLPDNKVSPAGFTARWKVLEYNRSVPDFLDDQSTINIPDAAFGVIIKHMVDHYTKAERTGKYMILFIGLTFLVVLLTETVLKIKIHIFQYLLIGIALAVFFTLLLSVSEFLGFDKAYFIAAAATTTQIFLYSLGMFNNRKSSLLLLLLLVCLFGYIFQLIRLENMALLVGSIGLFVIVGITMFVTRKIKWLESATP